jgi:Leucine-rich repeat (LRR) protein
MSELKFISQTHRQDFYSRETRRLIHRNTDLTKVPKLPKSLEILDVSDNKGVKKLPKLPPNLRELYCAECDLQEIPRLPESLVVLSCANKAVRHSKFPRGLRALRVGYARVDGAWLPNELQVLLCNSIQFGDLVKFPATLRVLVFDSGCKFPDGSMVVQLPPKLRILQLRGKGIARIFALPPSLRYLDVGEDACELPELPDRLEVLIIQENKIIKKLPKLPSGLKYLNVARSAIDSLPELPPRLESLMCGATSISVLPELPRGLKYLDIHGTLISGTLIVPDKVEELHFVKTQVDEVLWRDGVPPLKYFSGWNSCLRRMPPLPENISIIDVANCNLVGSWKGYFANAQSIFCGGNKITKMPDIARAERLGCQNNLLNYLPCALVEAKEAWYAGNPCAGKEFSNVVIPSLKELAGEVVHLADLVDKVPVADLREYLGGFRDCPKCGRRVVLKRKFVKIGALDRPAMSPTCHRCRPQKQTIKIPCKIYRFVDTLDRYLSTYVEYYTSHRNNSGEWFRSVKGSA